MRFCVGLMTSHNSWVVNRNEFWIFERRAPRVRLRGAGTIRGDGEMSLRAYGEYVYID